MFFLFRCLKPFFFLVRLKGRHLDSMLLACKQKVHIYDFQTLCLPCCIYLLTTCVAENCREKYNLFPNYFVAGLSVLTNASQAANGRGVDRRRRWRGFSALERPWWLSSNDKHRLKYTSKNLAGFCFSARILFSQFMSLFKCHMYHGKVHGYAGTKRSNDFDIFSPLRYEKIASSLPLCPKSHFRIPK